MACRSFFPELAVVFSGEYPMWLGRCYRDFDDPSGNEVLTEGLLY